MASTGAEHEDQINEWMQGFAELPADRQDQIKRWFATQKLIIDCSGLTDEAWFTYIQWAMDNPFDYSFIKDFPDMGEMSTEADGAERADPTKDARALVGGQVAARAPDGEGIHEKGKSEAGLERELFDRFMRNRRS